MRRNEPSTDVKRYSWGAIFTVDGGGNITPTSVQIINRGESILIQPDPSSTTPFSGQMCASQSNICHCSIVVGVPIGTHMTIGVVYTIGQSVQVGSGFRLYAVTNSGPVQNATNGEFHVGSI